MVVSNFYLDLYLMLPTPTNRPRMQYVKQYQATFPKMAWQLNQDPFSDQATASTEWALNTLIHNSGLLFFAELPCPRWQFATESLAVQGFPVVPGMFNFEKDSDKPRFRLCSFNVESPERKVRGGCAQAGNSMHCFVMTALQLHSLICYRWQKIPDLIYNVAWAARYNRIERKKMQPRQPRLRLRRKTPAAEIVLQHPGSVSSIPR